MAKAKFDHGYSTDRASISRRIFILGSISISYPVLWSRSALGQQSSSDLSSNRLDEKWMARAEEVKRNAMVGGDQPYGAVVVKDGQIVGEGPSRVITDHDATAHAEMEAIRDASKRLRTRDLSGCVLYATSKPCRMCETAAYWAGISRFVYGSGLTDGGAPAYSSC